MSVLTLQNTINWARSYNQFIPLTAGTGQEPAISIASMIRNAFLGAPQTWFFNRNEITFTLSPNVQDYAQSISANGNDFAYIESVSLTDDKGNIFQVKDVLNYSTLAKAATGVDTPAQRPNAISMHKMSVNSSTGVQTVTFRFLGVPDQAYTATIVYQKLAPQFGPFTITSVGNASGGNTTYTGIFDPYSLQAGILATVAGSTNAVNNGNFVVVSSTPTSVVLANPNGVAETSPVGAVMNNFAWDPIPNQFSDVYNSLFLAEVFIIIGDEKQADIYRKRGVAAFLARAEGLTDTQKNAFIQQFLARDRERANALGRANLGVQAKSI